jgi:hypothetical protein
MSVSLDHFRLLPPSEGLQGSIIGPAHPQLRRKGMPQGVRRNVLQVSMSAGGCKGGPDRPKGFPLPVWERIVTLARQSLQGFEQRRVNRNGCRFLVLGVGGLNREQFSNGLGLWFLFAAFKNGAKAHGPKRHRRSMRFSWLPHRATI